MRVKFCLLLVLAAVPLMASDALVVAIRRFEPEANLCRAGRAERVIAVIENAARHAVALQARLTLPEGVRNLSPETAMQLTLLAGEVMTVQWLMQAASACNGQLALELLLEGKPVASSSLRICFLPPLDPFQSDGIPPPQPVNTTMLVGAHHCPLWESDRAEMWANVLKHPERTPALGFYSQENPEVSDWETKWAVEHGISFFIYCWYRTAQGGPIKMRYSSAIHEALFKSRFVDRMKYTIMWENQIRGSSGVADEQDLFENLMPFWLENYFKHPSYLKVDNKPVLFVYRPEYLVQDLGSKEAVQRAFDRMRQVCRDAGFDGLTILGEYRGLNRDHLGLLKDLGLDATFAYCWGIPGSPAPEQAIAKQMENIRTTQELNVLPQVITVSQAWSGWRDEGSIWKIPPKGFESLLRQAKAFSETLPEAALGRRMLLLDNWNEWGEGHYLAPYREYGFGYLDAVRRVFAPDAAAHVDLLPEDIGLGPYDTAIRTTLQEREKVRVAARRYVTKPGHEAPGLVAWWAFDEKNEAVEVLDFSGYQWGGRLLNASRATGMDGNALVCTGGCARIESCAAFSVTTGVTVSCRVKTDVAGQDQAWIVNRVLGGGESTGFRLGVMGGKPCFNVPLTAWSHTAHSSKPLPVGRWVHLAGTFDGGTIRIYMDGEECGSLARPGPMGGNNFPIFLGSYTADHAAHFTGLLDEVQLYNRALSLQEIRGL